MLLSSENTQENKEREKQGCQCIVNVNNGLRVRQDEEMAAVVEDGDGRKMTVMVERRR